MPGGEAIPMPISIHADTVSTRCAPQDGCVVATDATSDDALMASLAAGQQAAFTTLFARYRQPVFGYFRRRLRDPGHAEELTQEVFLALLRAASRYKPAGTFRAYLFGIAAKQLSSYRRRAALRATFFLDACDVPEPAVPAAAHDSLLVREALSTLAPDSREILMLREFEQLSYDEIAAVLHLPVNTVRSRLFRARSALQTVLAAPPRRSVPGAEQPKPRKESASC